MTSPLPMPQAGHRPVSPWKRFPGQAEDEALDRTGVDLDPTFRRALESEDLKPGSAMPPRAKVPHRNRSHTGWWVYGEVEYWVSKRQASLTDTSRCPVWENLRLIRAPNREAAHRRAMQLGRAEHPSKTHDGEWRFAGISMLSPVYEEIEDGVELLWKVRGRLPMERIRKLVKSRRQLPVFDDGQE